ncbi:XRE family transcriptional regulator [Desulfosporosinus sp. Tol-M]|jgi:hypothetical protein|nr:XRE family transcriptional regulator [Desulfosporosinus sp. Tol-M]
MAISNDDLLKLVKLLPEEAKQSAYDFLKFLTIGHKRPDWDEIDLLETDDIPLSEEEELQMNNNTEFVSWEDAMHELNLPTDIKP